MAPVTPDTPAERRLLVLAPALADDEAGRSLLELVAHATEREQTPVTILAWDGGALAPRAARFGAVRAVSDLRHWSPAALAERILRRVGAVAAATTLRRRRLRLSDLDGDSTLAVHLTSPRAAALLRFLPADLGPVVTSVTGDELTAVDPGLLNEADLDLLLERTDRFLVAREASWTYLVGRLGVAPNRLRWSAPRLLPSRPTPPSAPRLAELRRRLDIPSTAPLVVGWGPREWDSGTDLFLRVAWLLSRDARSPAARFLWVGRPTDPYEATQLEHDRVHMGLADRLQFVDDDDADVIWLADVQLVTSRDETEQPVYEPPASRSTAFVAFRSDLLQRFVGEHGSEAGILVDFLDLEGMADAAAALLADEERRHALGERAGQRFGEWHAGDERSPRLFAEIRNG